MVFYRGFFLLFKVMTGGNLDIDVVIQTPSNTTIYDEKRNQQDNFQFTTTVGVIVFVMHAYLYLLVYLAL